MKRITLTALAIIASLLLFSCHRSETDSETYFAAQQETEAASHNEHKSAPSKDEIISELKKKNRELEEEHKQFFTYFLWLTATILTGSVILVFLNVRESKRKDKIIYSSEQFLQHSIRVQEAERKRISLELHAAHVDLVLVVIDLVDALALLRTRLLKLEGEGLAIDSNGLVAGLHGTVACEVVPMTAIPKPSSLHIAIGIHVIPFAAVPGPSSQHGAGIIKDEGGTAEIESSGFH